MAQSRLEKIGTIFTRVSGLLRSGAMKPDEKPIWYNVYAAFPPKVEPRFDRPVPNMTIRDIFYEEDVIRAKYHKLLKQAEYFNMSNVKHQTQTQHLITIYNDLKQQGALDEHQIFDTALALLTERKQLSRTEPEIRHLVEEATQQVSEGKKDSSPNDFDIKDIFKE